MEPWENLALQGVGALGQLGLQFGQAYGNYWLSKEQLETQYELAARYRPQFVPPLAGSGLLLILLVVGAVLIFRK